jgi:hypothetical protein
MIAIAECKLIAGTNYPNYVESEGLPVRPFAQVVAILLVNDRLTFFWDLRKNSQVRMCPIVSDAVCFLGLVLGRNPDSRGVWIGHHDRSTRSGT